MVVDRVLRWLVFTVGVTLLPLWYAWARAYQAGEVHDAVRVLGGGELYLAAAALSAGGIGELTCCGAERSRTRSVACGLAVLVVGLASLLFADVHAVRTHATGTATHARLDAEAVAEMSAWVFALSVVIGSTCAGLGERCSTTKSS